MSSRTTKRRKLNAEGVHEDIVKDSVTDISTSGYYLRSSARSRKRKFVTTLVDESAVEEQEEGGEEAAIEDPENAENIPPSTMLKNGKLSKIQNLKNLITSGISKITHPAKAEKENEENETVIVVASSDVAATTTKQSSATTTAIELEAERVRATLKREKEKRQRRRYEHDEKGYIVFHKGLLMNERYLVQRRLGKGTFSKVFCCIDQLATDPTERKVAVKVIRNQHKYQIAARTELRILDALKRGDVEDRFQVIKLVESCYFEQHPMLVFPLYGRSLYHYLYDNNFRPFPDSHIKMIAKQIVSAVAYSHSLGIIITDLKPENIIICNDDSDRHVLGDNSIYHTLKSRRVRLIDFGSAVFHEPRSVHKHLIQTRHYRAPEVMFKFNWSFAADLWSIGCVIVELANGKMLFNTHDTIDHLNQIVVAIGPMPSNMVRRIDENVYDDLFHFDGQLALHRAHRSNVQCAKLKSYFHAKYHHKIYDLVKKMLTWDAQGRITAAEALQHPLFKDTATHSDKA